MTTKEEQLCQQILDLSNEVQLLKDRIAFLTAKDRGEIWYWDTDGSNDVDSITCPIQIPAPVLKSILDAAAYTWLREDRYVTVPKEDSQE